MDIDFRDISGYLKHGNSRQRAAYAVLTEHRVMERLAPYGPLLAGTIPIGIDIPSSDLDILCHARNMACFTAALRCLFGSCEGFTVRRFDDAAVASFRAGDFWIEVFGQDRPPHEQSAWRHMLAEHRILAFRGEEFRRHIIELKVSGMKTEPAFALMLGLEGDPYAALLGYADSL